MEVKNNAIGHRRENKVRYDLYKQRCRYSKSH